MAYVRTDDKHYSAIANQIRSFTGQETPYKPAQMPAGVAEVHKAGETAEKARCAAKHFVTTITGNGQASMSFKVPFEPDALYVFVSEACMYGKYSRDVSAVAAISLDLAGFGMIGGQFYVYWKNGMQAIVMTTTSIHSRYSQTDDGVVILQNVADSTITNSAGEKLSAIFADGREYVVIAMKYIDKTDKERITEYVRSLTGSGSVILNKAKVNAAFTDAEWAALIAEKPGWTFSFI